MPAATPVIVTVQAPVESSVQLASTVPIAMSDEVKLTVPVGTFDGVVMSVTVTLQELVPPTLIEEGHETLVDVLSRMTVIVPELPELPKWVESPPYVPITPKVPGATPVAEAVQLPDDRVQLIPTVPIVVLVERKLTDPDGVFDGLVVSATVTVQVEVLPILIEVGLQTTLVEVLSGAAGVTVIVPEAPELPLWVESPP
jgi:hypothetical protein